MQSLPRFAVKCGLNMARDIHNNSFIGGIFTEGDLQESLTKKL